MNGSRMGKDVCKMNETFVFGMTLDLKSAMDCQSVDLHAQGLGRRWSRAVSAPALESLYLDRDFHSRANVLECLIAHASRHVLIVLVMHESTAFDEYVLLSVR